MPTGILAAKGAAIAEQQLLLQMQQASEEAASKEHSLWNANVSPITQINDETMDDEKPAVLHEASALYKSFQSENITDTIDADDAAGGPNVRLINHQVLDN